MFLLIGLKNLCQPVLHPGIELQALIPPLPVDMALQIFQILLFPILPAVGHLFFYKQWAPCIETKSLILLNYSSPIADAFLCWPHLYLNSNCRFQLIAAIEIELL